MKTGRKFLHISLGNEFLDLTPKAKATKVKINKLKSFCRVKEIINKIKRQPTRLVQDGRVEGRALTPSCKRTGIITNC